MKVLIACESSGVVREAFAERGFDAWSCDTQPTEQDGQHLQTDVRNVLDWNWDLIIAHPPCTYLANSGVCWLYEGGSGTGDINEERFAKMEEAVAFFELFLNHPCERVAIENPIMHGFASERIKASYAQIIQPYYFGDPHMKSTCLWLKGLPRLEKTDVVVPEMVTMENGEQMSAFHYHSFRINGDDRSKERSRTFEGIARAMARQWGMVLESDFKPTFFPTWVQ